MLYFAYIYTHFIWKLKLDPDLYAIPLLTAITDFMGTSLLYILYIILEATGDANSLPVYSN